MRNRWELEHTRCPILEWQEQRLAQEGEKNCTTPTTVQVDFVGPRSPGSKYPLAARIDGLDIFGRRDVESCLLTGPT